MIKLNLLFLNVVIIAIFISCSPKEEAVDPIPPYIQLKYPFNNGDLSADQNLQWEGLDYSGESLSYDFYLGEQADQLQIVIENTDKTGLSCNDLGLKKGVGYYWKVVAKNQSLQQESDVWKFTFKEVSYTNNADPTSIVKIYSACGYTGNVFGLKDQSYSLSRVLDIGGSDNANSSLKIEYGYNVTMYRDDNFNGDYVVKANDDECLDNDGIAQKATSYQVCKTPVWKMITLVLTRIEMDKDGTHYSYTMSDSRKDSYVNTARNLPSVFKEWSNNQAVMEMDVVVVADPVTDMQPYGNGGYYPHTAKLTSIMDKYVADKTYGSLFLCIDMGPVPKGSNWVGLGMGPTTGTKGATYACMTVIGAGAWVHEWLHGAGSWMRSKLPHLDVPDPHENGQFGYTSANTSSWDIWYKAVLEGELQRNGKPAGYTGECWKFGGPNSRQ